MLIEYCSGVGSAPQLVLEYSFFQQIIILIINVRRPFNGYVLNIIADLGSILRQRYHK